MANRYWVGGTADWNGTALLKWSTTSGGLGGAAEPTSSDDVFFDSNSGVNTITITSSDARCNNLTCTGFSGTLTGSGGNMIIFGNLILSNTMVFSVDSSVSFTGISGSKTLDFGGLSISTSADFVFDGVGITWTLQSNLIISGVLDLVNGVLDANNKNVTCGSFDSNNTNIRTLTMGSGTWTITDSGSSWYLGAGTNLTFNSNTSTLKFTDSNTGNVFFDGSGKTYYNIWNATSGSDIFIFINSNTFNDIKIDAGRTVKFTDGTTQTISSITCIAGTQRTLQGTSTGGWSISDTSGTNSVSNCTISYSTASGGAIWNALLTDGNVNGGNNAGWVFTTNNGAGFIGII